VILHLCNLRQSAVSILPWGTTNLAQISQMIGKQILGTSVPGQGNEALAVFDL
jgi:hypothetical protein